MKSYSPRGLWAALLFLLASLSFFVSREVIAIGPFCDFTPGEYGLAWRYDSATSPWRSALELLTDWVPPWILTLVLPFTIWWIACRWLEPHWRGSPFSLSWPRISLTVTGVFLTLAWLRAAFFHNSPITVDEYAYHFQAELFAQGRLLGDPWPDPQAFRADGLISVNGGTMIGWQPGWPLLLAGLKLAALDGAANLLVWLLMIGMVGLLAAELWGEASAKSCLLVLSLCPPLWMLALGDFPNLAVAALTLSACFFYLRRNWFALTCCWSLIGLTRIQDLICALGVVAAWWALEDRSQRSGHRLGLALVASLAVTLGINFLQTGRLLTLPSLIYQPTAIAGFGFEKHVLSVVTGLIFSLARLLWWSAPLIGILWARAPEKSGWSWREKGLAVGACIPLAVYLSHRFGIANVDWVARYYTQSVVLGCMLWGRRLASKGWLTRTQVTALILTFLLGLQAVSFCAWRCARISLPPDLPPALYFYRIPPPGVYRVSLIRNSPDLNPPVAVHWLNPATNERVRTLFPELKALVIDFEQGRFRVRRASQRG